MTRPISEAAVPSDVAHAQGVGLRGHLDLISAVRGDGHSYLRHQEFSVAAGGWFENWPELLIPQVGARYRQSTTIRLEEGAELLFFEMLAPGRVASGEAFAYDWLEWATDLFVAHRHAARERYRLCPSESGSAWRPVRHWILRELFRDYTATGERLSVLGAHPLVARSRGMDRLQRTHKRGMDC